MSESLLDPTYLSGVRPHITSNAKVSLIGKYKSNPQMDAPAGGSPSKSWCLKYKENN